MTFSIAAGVNTPGLNASKPSGTNGQCSFDLAYQLRTENDQTSNMCASTCKQGLLCAALDSLALRLARVCMHYMHGTFLIFQQFSTDQLAFCARVQVCLA